MKLSYLVLMAAALMASTAAAQSSFEGPYAGVSIATFSGENEYGSGFEVDLEGRMLGAFAGYNMLTERFIVGGEISILTGTANEEDFEGAYEYTSLIDLKARVGLPIDDFMPYAFLGTSFGTFAFEANDGGVSGREFEETEMGVFIGLGADYAINEQVRIGAEFVSRRFDFEFPVEANLADVEGIVNSIALRGSYSF